MKKIFLTLLILFSFPVLSYAQQYKTIQYFDQLGLETNGYVDQTCSAANIAAVLEAKREAAWHREKIIIQFDFAFSEKVLNGEEEYYNCAETTAKKVAYCWGMLDKYENQELPHYALEEYVLYGCQKAYEDASRSDSYLFNVRQALTLDNVAPAFELGMEWRYKHVDLVSFGEDRKHVKELDLLRKKLLKVIYGSEFYYALFPVKY